MNKKILASLLTVSALGMAPSFASSFTNAQVNAMTGAELDTNVTALADGQVRFVQPAALAAMSNVTDLSQTQRQNLGFRQVEALTTDQIRAMDANISDITPSSFRAFSSTQVAAMEAAEVAALSVDQIAALGEKITDIAAIGSVQNTVLSALSADAVAKLEAADITAIGTKVSVLSTDAISAIQNSAVASLAASSLANAANINALGKKALWLPEAELANALTTSGADLSVSFAGLTAQDITDLGTSLSANHITVLGDHISNFSEAALGALTSAQVDELTVTRLNTLASEGKLDAIAPGGISATFPAKNTTNMATLADATLAAFSAEQVTQFSPAQLKALNTKAGKLSVDAVKALIPSQIAQLEEGELDAMASAGTLKYLKADAGGLDGIPDNNISALTEANYTAFSKEQVQAFTAAQLGVIADISGGTVIKAIVDNM